MNRTRPGSSRAGLGAVLAVPPLLLAALLSVLPAVFLVGAPAGPAQAQAPEPAPGTISSAALQEAQAVGAQSVADLSRPGDTGTPAGTAPGAVLGQERPRQGSVRERLREVGRQHRVGLFHTRQDWDAEGWMVRAALTLLTLPLAFWLYRRPWRVNAVKGPGFEVVSPTEGRQFIPLEEKFAQLDFVTKLKTIGALRLSANLNKVSLSNRRFGYLMEDKNYRNALLVNRRRVRRTLLKEGDLLDLGDLTLLYRDSRIVNPARNVAVAPPEGKVVIKFDRVRGPIRKGVPVLASESQANRTFFISKNLVFIGRSEDNDLIIKSPDVGSRHAKIERVGGRFKLQDLSSTGSTFVNGRRVEQRFLREGDEIAFDSYRFKFSFVTKPFRERPAQPEALPEETLPDAEEMPVPEEAGTLAQDQEADRP